jgi:aspartate/methionine/tyrosine aminotransferase
MHLEPFHLDHWIEKHRNAPYNLAASTGPAWTLKEVFELMTPEEQDRWWSHKVVYGPPSGGEILRAAVAEMEGVRPQEVQVVTGASEALLILFFLAAQPGANVVVPDPSFPVFTTLPDSLGLETRRYSLRPETGFRIDVDDVRKLLDHQTRLLLVNSPHNPSGAIATPETLRELHDLAAGRGIPFVVDQVYHRIYYDQAPAGASALPHTTILGDLSKALSLSGLRLGWIIERDEKRREQYENARAYFTIANSSLTELPAVAVIRMRDKILKRGRQVALTHLELLDRFFETHRDTVTWVRPQGGFTGFPQLMSGEDSRPLCEAAAAEGVALVPGVYFGRPAHFRLGFGACQKGFSDALGTLSDVLTQVAHS